MKITSKKKIDNSNYCTSFVIFQKLKITILNIVHTPFLCTLRWLVKILWKIIKPAACHLWHAIISLTNSVKYEDGKNNVMIIFRMFWVDNNFSKIFKWGHILIADYISGDEYTVCFWKCYNLYVLISWL